MKILRIRDVKLPQRGTSGSAGLDIFVPNQGDFFIKLGDEYIEITDSLTLQPGQSVLIPTGLKINVPEDRALIMMNKSGIAVKKSLVIGACVIDEDYQGEIHIDIKNVGKSNQEINAGDKLTQVICVPIDYVNLEEVESESELFPEGETQRGTGGFGSTGTK